jgi:hypothetical protein
MAGTMTTQRLHSNLAPLDVLTREELSQELHKGLDAAVRTRFLGLELQRIPSVPIMATSSTQALYTSNDATPWGPEQGDVWMLRRVIVKSNSLTDAGYYVVYRGSTPSDVNNAYTSRWLLDGFIPPTAAPTPSQPSVPSSTVAQQNTNSYPVSVTITGGTLTAVIVNGITVGSGDGTYTVPAYGAISITYSVAPTWSWANANTAVPLGEHINCGYYFTSKAVYLQPGEQLYAQVFNATVNNQYTLDAEAIRCPAEMKGKIL